MAIDQQTFQERVSLQPPDVRIYLDEVATKLYANFAGAVILRAHEDFVMLMEVMTERFKAEIGRNE